MSFEMTPPKYSIVNVQSPTAAIVQISNGPTRQYVFRGSVTTPRALSADDYTGLQLIASVHVVMIDRTNPEQPVDREVYVFRGPIHPNKVMKWESAPFPVPVSGPTLVFTPDFRTV